MKPGNFNSMRYLRHFVFVFLHPNLDWNYTKKKILPPACIFLKASLKKSK